MIAPAARMMLLPPIPGPCFRKLRFQMTDDTRNSFSGAIEGFPVLLCNSAKLGDRASSAT